jgi:YggT family protein
MIYLIQIIDLLFTLYTYLILARVFLSWVNPDPYNPIVRFIYQATEPVLRPFRVLFKMGNVAFDLSPIIAFFVLNFLRKILIGFLMSI